MLTDRQKQIVIGTVLGGSSLLKPPKGRNYYLSMRSRDEVWLRYKMEELQTIFGNQIIYRYGNTYRCYSRCHGELSVIRQQLFNRNKRIMSEGLFDDLRLQDISLAIWYLEGGGKTGRDHKNAYLNTTAYGIKGAKIIRNYFNIIGCSCNVNKNKKRSRVVFSLPGTEKLFKLTAHLFPSFML